jgi:hypothetical protein
MDLGLGELTDDQLLELVNQACAELVVRDPFIRQMAQSTITTWSEQLILKRAMIKEAVTALAGAYIEQIRKETFAEVKAAVSAGEARLLSPTQEARVVVESTIEAKIQMIDELVALTEKGKRPPVPATDTEDWLTARANNTIDPRPPVDPYDVHSAAYIQRLREDMARVLAAGCTPKPRFWTPPGF